MAWGIQDTLLHVEIDENGENHEDDDSRFVDIHAASGLKNNQPCLKKSRLASGDQVYRMYSNVNIIIYLFCLPTSPPQPP